MKCEHEQFEAKVDVHRMTDSGRFEADVRIKCKQCDEYFRFLGLPCGLDLNGAAVSADGTEARLAIGTNETVANIVEGVCPVGFTVENKTHKRYTLYVDGSGFAVIKTIHGPITYTQNCLEACEAIVPDWRKVISYHDLFGYHFMERTTP